MPDPQPPVQPTPHEGLPKPTLNLEGIFHHTGRFPTDTVIYTGMGMSTSMLRIDQESPNGMNGTYIDLVRKYQENLPQTPESGFFPSGLSREQLSRVQATQEYVFTQNGGLPNEHSMQRNRNLYEDTNDLGLSLSEFTAQGKGAWTCAESSAQTQQLLTPLEDVTYVSGVADLSGDGKGETHSFNIIKVADPKYAGAILDIANPTYVTNAEGITVRLYCAPLTQKQLTDFQQGIPITLDYGGVQRTYKYGMFLDRQEDRPW